MARSLNPNATPPASPRPPSAGQTEETALQQPPRRNVLAAVVATIIGAFVGLAPVAAGVATFLDPLFRRKKVGGEGAARQPVRVASLDALPADGTPVQVPVVADLTDAWNREPNQPIGAVYLRRVGNGVVCFNAICPHAGCFVGYAADRKVFQCPCHTSSFQLDGERIIPSPSPRNMDELKVEPEKLKQGEVWIEFVNYYPGKEDREEKPT
jgi:quinol---cytochrome c reductase iron-sulfur subunit, bacillus type